MMLTRLAQAQKKAGGGIRLLLCDVVLLTPYYLVFSKRVYISHGVTHTYF